MNRERRKLSESDVISLNGLIAHCERLLVARGRFNDRAGLYQSDPFEVLFTRTEEETDLQVRYNAETVLRVHWDEPPTDPAIAICKLGAWQSQFLAVRAAHA